MSQEDADPGNLVLRAADAFNAGVRVCRVCGCTEDDPCVFGDPPFDAVSSCCWVGPNLCSACSDGSEAAGAVASAPLLYDAYGGVLVR